MLHSSQVSKSLWAEAVVTANRIRNCSPTTGHTKTLWELFYNVKRDFFFLNRENSPMGAKLSEREQEQEQERVLVTAEQSPPLVATLESVVTRSRTRVLLSSEGDFLWWLGHYPLGGKNSSDS
jgi:hypothetical protein